MTLSEILQQNPAPWTHVVFPGGNVVILDANKQTVQLFTMIEFVSHVTAQLAQRPAPVAQPEPAAEPA